MSNPDQRTDDATTARRPTRLGHNLRLAAGAVGVAALVATAGAVVLSGFTRTHQVLDRIAEQTLPALALAADLGRLAGALEGRTWALVRAGDTFALDTAAFALRERTWHLIGLADRLAAGGAADADVAKVREILLAYEETLERLIARTAAGIAAAREQEAVLDEAGRVLAEVLALNGRHVVDPGRDETAEDERLEAWAHHAIEAGRLVVAAAATASPSRLKDLEGSFRTALQETRTQVPTEATDRARTARSLSNRLAALGRDERGLFAPRARVPDNRHALDDRLAHAAILLESLSALSTQVFDRLAGDARAEMAKRESTDRQAAWIVSALAGLAVATAATLAIVVLPGTGRRRARPAPPPAGEAPEPVDAVLVAEDDSTTRMVLERLLGRLGVPVETVADGAAALEALKTRRFALLLTDGHMPRLDGFALARHIRAAEAGTGVRLPIVAVTADPPAADLSANSPEDWRAAGMDDCLAKPIDAAALAAAVRRFLPGVGEPPAALTPAPGPVPDSAPNADPDVLDRSVLAAVLGEDGDVDSALRRFVPAVTATAGDLRRAVAAQDWAEARQAAHAAKGAALSAGARRLAELCARIQDRIDANDLDAAAFLATLLDETVDEVRRTVSGGGS